MPMFFLLLALALTPVWSMQTTNTGRLTLVVRDEAGTPLAGVEVGLYHDADEGRREVGTYTTDSAGQVVFDTLQWGLYIVQFRGTLANGAVMQPAPQQNLGLLDDGSGAGNGFGVRFAEADRTELFVLTRAANPAVAVPAFDLAPHASAPPQPVTPVPYEQLAAQPSQPRAAASTGLSAPQQPRAAASAPMSAPVVAPPPTMRRIAPWACVVGLLILAAPIALGWYRAHQEGRIHAR
jgi:hypothetical protein